jgi:hypothetical protein
MKNLKLLGTTALMGIILATSMPVMASDTAMSAQQEGAQKSSAAASLYQEQLKEASEMVGQVDLARHALDLGMNHEAIEHIRKARLLSDKLKERSPELLVASTLRAGDKVYTFNNEYKDYLIPVVDDLFTTEDFNVMVKSNPSKDKAAENMVGVGRYSLALDIRNVSKALNDAAQMARDSKLAAAREALNNIYIGAVETSVAYEDPIWAVHDNLMASQAMITDQDYDGARFALKNAEKGLSAIEKSGQYSENSDTIKILKEEVVGLQYSLEKKDPTISQKAEQAISGWLKDIRSIGHHST